MIAAYQDNLELHSTPALLPGFRPEFPELYAYEGWAGIPVLVVVMVAMVTVVMPVLVVVHDVKLLLGGVSRDQQGPWPCGSGGSARS